jgi:hypothetical protein
MVPAADTNAPCIMSEAAWAPEPRCTDGVTIPSRTGSEDSIPPAKEPAASATRMAASTVTPDRAIRAGIFQARARAAGRRGTCADAGQVSNPAAITAAASPAVSHSFPVSVPAVPPAPAHARAKTRVTAGLKVGAIRP